MVLGPRKWIWLIFLAVFAVSGCAGSRASQKSKGNSPYAKGKKREHRRYSGKIEKGMFIWPSDGPVNSGFGMRWGRPHDGIDIGGDEGDPVLASGEGEVVFSDRLGGYGNLIVVKHRNGLFSAYGHNKKNLVSVGAKVKQGQRIAKMGRTGHATGEHVHFEIRDQQSSYDPMQFLPKDRYAGWGKKPLTAMAEKKQIAEPRAQAFEGNDPKQKVMSDSTPPRPQEADVPSEAMIDLLSDL